MVYQSVISEQQSSPGWPASASPVAISTKLTKCGTQLILIREISCDDVAVVSHVCWRQDHADEEQAEQVFEALSPFQERFTFWSAGAIAVGEQWLSRNLRDICTVRLEALAKERERLAEVEKAARKEEDEKRAYEAAVHAFFRQKGDRFVVAFNKGHADDPFWTISFEEAWERDRFWDWMAWQLHRYDEYTAFLNASTRLELERKLLREMLLTEQTVKKQGLGAGGRRPLRFWRGEL